MEQEQLLEQLSQDKEFTDKLSAVNDLRELAKLFAAEGVKVSTEELQQIAVLNTDGELDEKALDHVAGGGKISPVFRYISKYLI